MTAEALPRDTQLPRASTASLWLPRLRSFLVDAIGQVRILRNAYPGVMHALIFWGMTIQIIGTIINLLQMQLFVPFVELQFPRGTAYLIYELLMDLSGVAIIVGVLMALFRRLVWRPSTLPTHWDDIYALVLLLIIPLLGFATEGLRLLATAPAWANWSPVGNATAGLFRVLGVLPARTETAHTWLYWIHGAVGLLFVASIPFTKLRHLIATPLNIVLRPLRRAGILSKIDNIDEAEVMGASRATEFASYHLMALDACVQCGRCEESCPATRAGIPFSPRAFIQSLRSETAVHLYSQNGSEPALFEETLGAETAWYCTTCGACLMACPAFVNPVDDVVELRRAQALMTGSVPNSVGLALRNIERQSNPWGLPASDRAVWTDGLDVPVIEPGGKTDVLFFAGCAAAFDDRNKKVAQALVRLLNAAGVDYAILGDAEMCCGETARRLGHEYLFQVLAEENIATFDSIEFSRVVTACPHCFNTLKNEYPDMGGSYTVQHYTELLREIQSQLPLAEANGSAPITYHDSCYLGRYNDLYEAPRGLLSGAGHSLAEMADRRAAATCCGGGGGQMWMETEADARINNLRLAQAVDTGAEIVATACPFCLLMFDDAIRSTGQNEAIEAKDIAEILASQLTAR